MFEIFSDPDNAESWRNRPATTEQEDQSRFFGEKIAKGLKHDDAAKFIDELSKANLDKLKRWDELRSVYEDAVDFENLELGGIKKFSW